MFTLKSISPLKRIPLIKSSYKFSKCFYLNTLPLYKNFTTVPNSPEPSDKKIISILSQENFQALPPKDLIRLISLVKTTPLMDSLYLNSIIEKSFKIKNDDLHKALEENLGTKLRTLKMLEDYQEAAELENFERERKKFRQRSLLFLKVTVVSFILMTGFRIYYYLEYEVDPMHPRVSDYLLNRFK